MNVCIWNKEKGEYIRLRNVKQIVQLHEDYFKIDGIEWSTSDYELDFVDDTEE